MIVTRKSFEILFDLVIKKCSQNPEFNFYRLKGARLFGFGKFSDKAEISIKGIMLQDQDVNEFIKTYHERTFQKGVHDPNLNGKYLYDRFREFDNEHPTIEFNGLYEELFFKFIGYPSIYEFALKELKGEDYEIQKALLNSEEGKVSTLGTEYECLYYSRKKSVKSFHMVIDYVNNLAVKEVGLHDITADSTVEKKYEGKGRINGNNIFIDLKSKDHDEVKMFINVGSENAQELVVMQGLFLGISALSETPISGEILLINSKKAKKNNSYNAVKTTAIRYLMLEKRSIRLPRHASPGILNFITNRHGQNAIEKMVGTFLIYSLSKSKSYIYRSKFVIDDQYNAILETIADSKGTEKQFCTLDVSHGLKVDKLMVEAFDSIHGELKNFAVIDCEEHEPDNNFEARSNSGIFLGGFAGIGVVNPGVLSGPIVLFKIDEHHVHFEVESIDVGSKVFKEVSKIPDYDFQETLGFLNNVLGDVFFTKKPEEIY